MTDSNKEIDQSEEICICFSSEKGNSTKGNELRNTYILSFSFFFVFTAFLAIQNLQSSLNHEEGLGVTSLSCVYGGIIISSVAAPTVIKIIGGKLALVIAWTVYIIYTISNFYPKFETLIPSSLLLGLISGPLWTAQGVYITRNAYSLADQTGVTPHAALSKLNGIFFTVYELTQIVGNIVSSSVLYKGSSNDNATTDYVKTCGVDDCPYNGGNETTIEQPQTDVVYILLGIYVGFGFIGLFLTTTFLPPLPKSQWSQTASLKTSVVSCFSTFCEVKMMLLVPFIAMLAMEEAVLWTDFTKSYISCPIGVKMVGFVMASYGGSTTLSSLLLSRLARYTGRHLLIAEAIIMQMSLYVAMYVYIPEGEKDLPYLFVMAVIWGLAEGIWQTQSNALVGILYPDKTEAAFANYFFWKSTSFTIFFAISTALCVKTKLIIAISLLAVSTVLYTALEIKMTVRKQNKDISKQ